jgi:hypothetical protein
MAKGQEMSIKKLDKILFLSFAAFPEKRGWQ